MSLVNKPPTWFWVITIVALLWNLGGIASFIMHVTMSHDTLQAMPEEERALYTDFPVWVLVTYCFAVFGSTLGNVLLLLRKKSATPVLIVSFIAIVLQMIYTVFMSRAVELHGPSALGIPVLVTVFGIVLIVLSKHATARGWMH
jgi:hypothetical protein